MKNLREFGPFTEEQIESLQKQMSEVRDRVDARRIGEDGAIVPAQWPAHQFGYRTSNTMILLTVDACTSGRWAGWGLHNTESDQGWRQSY